jgi:hypothetical protein
MMVKTKLTKTRQIRMLKQQRKRLYAISQSLLEIIDQSPVSASVKLVVDELRAELAKMKKVRVWTLKLEYDSDLSKPDEDYDGQWTLYSFSPRHTSFKHPNEFFNEKGPISPGLRQKLKSGLAWVLSYFEHGDSMWMLADGPHPAGVEFQWDGTRFAGLLVWEHKASDMGAKTVEDRKKDAQSFLEIYNDWANGHGYYFAIEDENGKDVESCGGFYDSNVKDMFKEYIRPAFKDKQVYVRVEGDAADLVHTHPVTDDDKKWLNPPETD